MSRRDRLELGPLVAAAGGIVLIVSLFLDWYEPGISGWTVFEALDLVLAACGLAVLARLALPSMGARVLTIAGAAAVAVVAAQAISHPPAGQERAAEVGQWLALGGAALLLGGSLLGRARISVELSVDRGDAEQPTERLGPPD